MSVEESSTLSARQELEIQIQEIDQKFKSYLSRDIYSSIIQSDENLEIAQILNKREWVKPILFYQIEELLLCH